jgi:hypothetical protein
VNRVNRPKPRVDHAKPRAGAAPRVDRDTVHAVGVALLAAAPLVFAVRAGLEIAARPDLPAWLFAIVGAAAGAGFIALIFAGRGTPDFVRAIIAAGVAMTGHTLVARFVDADLGAAMVYLGIGFAGSLHVRSCAYAGLIAGTGAILRGTEARTLGLLFVLLGGALLAGLLTWGVARTQRAAPGAATTPEADGA